MKKVKLHSQEVVTAPTVFVTKNKQRVKQYGTTVYLKNGDEFEIELFNPTSQKVLAKISLNGNSLGPGIVLRPGERVFLERYFDEAKKFVFETYNVDGNNPNVQAAIKDNGEIDVEFYEEYVPCNYNYTYTYNPGHYEWVPDKYTTGGRYLYYSTGNTVTQSSNDVHINNISSNKYISNNMYYTNDSLETGRVERGSSSNQEFVYDGTSFNTWYTWKVIWKILPKSQKPVVKEDLQVFCANCGAKRKRQNYQFCPYCGNKFD
jgi:hypothetical protein